MSHCLAAKLQLRSVRFLCVGIHSSQHYIRNISNYYELDSATQCKQLVIVSIENVLPLIFSQILCHLCVSLIVSIIILIFRAKTLNKNYNGLFEYCCYTFETLLNIIFT